MLVHCHVRPHLVNAGFCREVESLVVLLDLVDLQIAF
jgi:hypothetical protein